MRRPSPSLASRVAPRPDRRAVVAGGLACALSRPARAQGGPTSAAIAGAFGEARRFDASGLVDLARTLSRRPYAAPAADLPGAFASLTFEQYVAIRSRPGSPVWSGEGHGVTIEPLHRGFIFTNPVQLFTVDDGFVRALSYDRARFDFGKLNVPAELPDLGFSGFRVFADIAGVRREVAIFQGATFFRSSAPGQNLGVMARALSLRTGDPRGEEIPSFRAFWIERPAPASGALVLHALLDSESVTGAYRFTVRPGDATIIDTEAVLFPRVAIDNVGFAGMAGMYLFGPNDRRGVDDVRPMVHEVSGLQIRNGHDEWIWRPLHNPETLQVSAFVDPSPKGFGLLQRERDLDAFRDDEQHFERRPSLWIEPIGEWGAGMVQLFEIPTQGEVNQNAIAYWRPKDGLAAGVETPFAYRQFWCWTPPERPPLAVVMTTRVGRGAPPRLRRFLVDFVGDRLRDAALTAEIKPTLIVSPGAIINPRIYHYPERGLCRVAFGLDPGSESASEMRLLIEAGGKPLSETWLYRWTP